MHTLTDALLDPILAADPAGPSITWYDDATGARTELSAITLANWAAKCANLLRDQVGVVPGDRVLVSLPAHWQSAGILLGAWWVGAEVTLDPDADAVAAFTTAPADPAAGAVGVDAVPDVDAVFAVSLGPFGTPLADLPIGVDDYASEVRVHGDGFAPGKGVPGTAPALDGLSIDQVLDRARSAARDHGVAAGTRVRSTLSWDSVEGILTGFVGPLSVGGALVLVDHLDSATDERRRGIEKITVVLDRLT